MLTMYRRTRLKPLLLCALVTAITGSAAAQTNPAQDASFPQWRADRSYHPPQPICPVASLPCITPARAIRANNTITPIKHVILIIGENRTFDHVYATYTPPRGQSVFNLLSEGIVNADGTPGPHASVARQWQATRHRHL